MAIDLNEGFSVTLPKKCGFWATQPYNQYNEKIENSNLVKW